VRVLVDGRALYDGSRSRGIGVFTRSLLAAMPVEVAALVTAGTPVPDGVEPVVVRRRLAGPGADLEHQLLLPADLRRSRADVFHSPGLHPPLASPVPWVQTLHDVTPLVFDHPWFAAERRSWRRRFRRLAGATVVAAVSHHTAADAVRVLGLDPGRVHVVPNGVDPSFRPPEVRPRPDPPYLLMVGVFGPHKGYREAFEVVAELAARGRPHRLAVVGRLDARTEAEVGRRLVVAGAADRVDLLGSVDHERLVALYQGASAVLVTSRYEGFGLPAVEAMACGTPVVAFANSSLAEVVAGGGALVADGDTDAMADEVERLLDDEARWRELSAAGRRRAADFDWAEAARRYAGLYALAATDRQTSA
jgi:glycosyltransferase involved in cell wall biosynthesis